MSDTIRRRLFYAGVTLVALAVLTHWFFHAGVLMKGDVLFHLNRIMGIASGLAAGDFPVYVHGFQMQGYGTLDGALYPDFLLYFPAALVCFGVPLAASYHVYWIFVTALGFCAAWRGFTLLSGRVFLGLLAAMLFSSCYFLTFCLGTSAGAYVACFFLPYAAGAIFAVLRRADGTQHWPELVLAFSVIVGSHVITTIFCLVALPFCLCLWRSGLRDAARRWALLLAAGFSLALSLYRLVPFAYFYRRVDFLIRHAVLPSLSSLTSSLGDLAAAQFWWGWPLLVLLFGALFSRALRRRWAFLATVACVILFTAGIWSGFPWQAIESIPPLGSVLPLFQFPMRLVPLALVPLAFFLARYLAAVTRRLLCVSRASHWARGLSLLLALLCVVYGIQAAEHQDFTMGVYRCVWQPSYVALDAQSLPSFGAGVRPDYLYADVDPAALFASGEVPQPGEVRALAGDLTVSLFEKVGTQLSFSYDSPAGAEVMVPLFFYPGYEAQVDGTRLTPRAEAHHVLALSLPAGEHQVTVRYRGPLSFRVSAWVSLLALFLFCFAVWRQWRRRRDSFA